MDEPQQVTGARRIESVQALRFGAAGLVVLAHCASGYFLPGVAGVDLFFVISGFIITRVMGQRSPGDFALDRLTRIYPIYWLALLPFLFVEWDGSLSRLLTSLTLWPYFGTMSLPFLIVGWTLSFELLFYLAAGLVLWSRRALLVLIPAYALCFALAARGAHPLFAFLGNPMVLEFVLGALLARLPETRFRALGLVAVLIGAVLLLAFVHPSFGDSSAVFRFTHRAFVWGPPAALIVWGGLQWEGAFKGWLWRFIVQGGEASYSLYLFHPTILLLAPGNPYLKLVLMPVVCVLASFPIRRWLELPLTKWARKAASRMVPTGLRSRDGTKSTS